MRRNRITCVDRKIDDHLLELSGIGPHWPQIAIVADPEFDLLAQKAFEQLADLRNHVGQLNDLGPQRLLAAECEQLPRKTGCTI